MPFACVYVIIKYLCYILVCFITYRYVSRFAGFHDGRVYLCAVRLRMCICMCVIFDIDANIMPFVCVCLCNE